MVNTKEFRVVFVSTESYDNALLIAKILISENIAACCTVIPNIKSFFGWQGTLVERNENLIIAKTSEANLNILESRVTELHTDEVPEIISLPLSESSSGYLSWMQLAIGDR
ncbi:MAG: divalent-cation tolerance protein CutA [Candidatus Kapabacteria bacterium]|nr:divalent-cation tolerance protein CutA [Candidatus Kapabacteria bacterium]